MLWSFPKCQWEQREKKLFRMKRFSKSNKQKNCSRCLFDRSLPAILLACTGVCVSLCLSYFPSSAPSLSAGSSPLCLAILCLYPHHLVCGFRSLSLPLACVFHDFLSPHWIFCRWCFIVQTRSISAFCPLCAFFQLNYSFFYILPPEGSAGLFGD